MKIDFDDLIRQGEDIKALKYLAKELYNNNKIGGTRKKFLNRVADEYEKLEENEAYASLRAIELIKENENLKQEIENLKYKLQYLTDCGIEKEEKYKEIIMKYGYTSSKDIKKTHYDSICQEIESNL